MSSSVISDIQSINPSSIIELFTLTTSAGTIIPNHSLGGGGITNNIVVNVDASGSNVEGDEQQSRELGLVLSTAIQAQLIQEKRPGGLLA